MTTRKSFRKGDMVAVGHAQFIPARYRGRTAEVVGKSKSGRGFRYEVSFGDRRVEPLPVPATQLTPLDW